MHRDNPDDIAGLFGIPETFLLTPKQRLDFIRLLRSKKVSEDALRDAARKLYESDFGELPVFAPPASNAPIHPASGPRSFGRLSTFFRSAA